jgi:hypothetical protein
MASAIGAGRPVALVLSLVGCMRGSGRTAATSGMLALN